jgi:hypothetical protein
MGWLSEIPALVAIAISAATGGALAFRMAQRTGHAIGKHTGRETVVVRAAEFGASFLVLLLVLLSFANSWVASLFSEYGVFLSALGAATVLLVGGLLGATAFVMLTLPFVLLFRAKYEP